MNLVQQNTYPKFDFFVLGAELEEQIKENLGEQDKIRTDLLEKFKDAYQSFYEKAERYLLDTGDGYGCAKGLSDFQDELIQLIYSITIRYIYVADNPSKSEHMSLIATGGYGRGHLAPGSDIDILFLLPYKQTPWGESVVEYVLYFLWDLGFKVGHATRSIDQCIQLSRSDFTIRTALLDARLICGDEDLFSSFDTRFRQDVMKGSAREFIEAKLEEQDERHEKSGKSRYLVEPNIKDGKGGLRDLHTLYWLSKYVTDAENAKDFVDAGIFSKREYSSFLRCSRFLWAVRCHLHFLTKRPEERLSFDLQLEMAVRLKYKDRSGRRAVERFMRHYFLIAKEVGALTRVVCMSLEIRELKALPSLSKYLRTSFWSGRKKLPDNDQFKLVNGRLSYQNKKIFEKDPINLIRLFNVAEKYKLAFHPDVIRLVRASWKLIDDDLRNNPEANEIFLELLSSVENSESTLRKMNEVGVLGRFIKDFGYIVCTTQFNMYHHYTIDEHLLKSVGILSEIENGDAAEEHPILSKLFSHIRYRRALYVAVFLHDVGKGQEEDHSIVGARIAEELCPRFGMSKAETDTVSWLIENHLLMSQVAQSRDLSDPKTIKDFADIVQSRERLMLLTILTVADIRAVGPEVWNGWKRQLLRTLYLLALPLVSGGYTDPDQEALVTSKQQKLLNELSEWSENDKDKLIQRHDDGYWLRTNLEQQIEHANLLRKWDERQQELLYSVNFHERAEATELSLITRASAALLSKIAGTCASSGANIVGAQISTTNDDIALDTIILQREFDDKNDEIRRVERIVRNLKQVISGKKSMDDLRIDERKQERLERVFPMEPEVLIDDSISDKYSVIEVNCFDKPGLLYDLTRIIADMKLDISSAHIATFGEKAVDVFYIHGLSKQSGGKTDLSDELRERLLSVLTE